MAKQIKGEEIIEVGALSEHRKDVEKTIEVYEKWEKTLIDIAKKTKKDISGFDQNKVKDVDAMAVATQKVNNAYKASDKIQRDLQKLEERRSQLRTQEGKELERKRIQLQEERKAVRDQIKLNKEQNGSIEQLRRKLSLVTEAWKRLSKEERENTKRGKRIVASKKAITEQLKQLEAATGDARRNVGNYGSALDSLSGKFRGAIKLAAQFGAAISGALVIKNALGVITDFDQAVTDLAAISGKTADELKPLNDQAKQLGATTQFTASEITGLQIELAKLGFTTQEITDSTGGIANFAAATGVEIPRAAALAGSSLRAFGLDATEIDRVVSTLGVATTKTALDFSQLENGLSTVAPVAASFGFSIEDTTALLGQLSNAGFDASSSATATRNILLNLADTNGALAKALGRPVTNAQELAEGLVELKASGIDLAGALELTDKRSVAAFNTFLENAETLPQLTDSITDVNDELTDMAEQRLDSVQGQLQRLNSAWEGFLLGTGESVGLVNTLKSAIGFLAENLTTIISVVGKLMAVYAIWIVRQKIINSGVIDYVKNIPKAIKGTKELSKNMQSGSSNASKFGSAMKGIGWTALIGLAFELASGFWDIASGANEAAFQTEVFNAASQKGQELASKFVSEQMKGVKDLQAAAERELETLRLKGATEEEIAKRELELMEQISDARKEARREVQIEISSLENQYSAQLRTLEQLGVNIDKLPAQLENAGGSFETFMKNADDVAADGVLTALFGPGAVIDEAMAQNELNKAFAEASVGIQKLINLRKEDANLVGEIKLGAEDIERTELKRRNIAKQTVKAVKEQKKELEDLAITSRELFERQIGATGTDVDQVGLQGDIELNQLEAFKQEYLRKRREIFGEDFQLSEQEIRAFDEIRVAIEAETQDKIRAVQFQKRQEAQNLYVQQLELEKQILEAQGQDQERIFEKERQIIDAKIQGIDQEIEMLETRKGPLDEQRIKNLERERELLLANQDAIGKEVEKVNTLADAYQNFSNAFNQLAQMRTERLEREIQKMEELAQSSRDRASELSTLRAQEGADVQETLAFVQEEEAKALARKEELERKKQRIEMANLVIQLISGYVNQGNPNPTGQALQDVTQITQFVQNLPTFWEGTDTTIGDSLGVKYSNQRDGVLVRADPSEMILNKDKVDTLKSLGITKTDDIVNVAKSWAVSGSRELKHDNNVVSYYQKLTSSNNLETKLGEMEQVNKQMAGYLKELSSRPSSSFDSKVIGDMLKVVENRYSKGKHERIYHKH